MHLKLYQQGIEYPVETFALGLLNNSEHQDTIEDVEKNPSEIVGNICSAIPLLVPLNLVRQPF
jgi:hypothetical protein